MRTLLTISFFLILTIGQSQTEGQLLEKAYKKKSTEILKQFFQNWHKEIQPISEKELSTLNDTIRQTYNVFAAFYKPQSIDSLGGSEWGNDIYKHVDFRMVYEGGEALLKNVNGKWILISAKRTWIE